MAFELKHNFRTGQFSVKLKKSVLGAIGTTLVISGFASLSSPWWLSLVIGILEASHIEIEDDYQWLISTVQIFIGALLLLLKYLVVDKKARQNNQDKNTWLNGNLSLEKIDHYFSELLDGHSYVSSEDTEFQKSYTYFMTPQNSFQLSKTKKLYEKYNVNSLKLHMFVGQNFWVFPQSQSWTNDYRYCLSPHLNEDREGHPSAENSRQYSAQFSDLQELQSNAIKSYHDFIKHLKVMGII